MKNLLLIFSIILISCNQSTKSKANTEEKVIMEEQDEWTTLFDGTSLDQWHGYNKENEMYDEWSIQDDVMVFTPSEEGGKNIVTNDNFTNFILSLEWKISEGGNSGIFWGVYEDTTYNEAYQTGPEIQVLDNERHPDALANPKYHQAGALYDMVQPTSDVCKPAGEWNTCVLKIDHLNNSASVELNGTQIIEFEPHGPNWDEMIANSKFADWEGFGAYQTGKIGLQDHSDPVFYRNIKIKRLPSKNPQL